MPAGLIDTHCHLDLAAFDADRDEVVGRAIEHGIERIIVPAVDISSIPGVIALAEKYGCVFAAVGVHPNDVPKDKPIGEVRALLHDTASHDKVVAIGEIGLDYHWDNTPHDIQQEWLRMQLDLATEVGLPVILHDREADQDILALTGEWITAGLPARLTARPGVFHSVSLNVQDAQIVISQGFYVGFTGPLTYKNAAEMRLVAAAAPEGKILVETDAPFLSPIPHRGERNEPAQVRLTADKLAEVRETPLELLCQQTTDNACRLFGLTPGGSLNTPA